MIVSRGFPGVGVDVSQLHVSFADILEAKLRSSSWGGRPLPQLSVQDDFWDAAGTHAAYVPQPSEMSLAEQREQAGDAGTL